MESWLEMGSAPVGGELDALFRSQGARRENIIAGIQSR